MNRYTSTKFPEVAGRSQVDKVWENHEPGLLSTISPRSMRAEDRHRSTISSGPGRQSAPAQVDNQSRFMVA